MIHNAAPPASERSAPSADGSPRRVPPPQRPHIPQSEEAPQEVHRVHDRRDPEDGEVGSQTVCCAVEARRLRCQPYRIRDPPTGNRRGLWHRRHKRRWDSVNMSGTYGIGKTRHFRKVCRGAHCDSTGRCRVVKKTGLSGEEDLLGRATSLGGRIRPHRRAVTSSGAGAEIAR